MTIHLRPALPTDLPFLRKMLYEAVFWRDVANKPTFEEAPTLPDVSRALTDWGERDGDTAVIATSHSNPVGAAWYRYMTEDNAIRGYIDETIPVLVIGVHSDYRHQGIGGKLIEWLIDHAAKHAIPQISLMVSKDNVALNLYQQQGFLEYADTGDSLLMVRDV
jgi:ribosomal protein S18 acetylase RimI-like enzyme